MDQYVDVGTGLAANHVAEDVHVTGVISGDEVKNLPTMFDEDPGLRGVGHCGVLVRIGWTTNDEVLIGGFDEHQKCFCPRFAAASLVGADHRLGDSRSGGQLGLSEPPEFASIPKHIGKVHMLNIADTLYSRTLTEQIL